MPEGNREIVLRVQELLARSYRTGEALQALLDLCAPDIRIDASRRVFNPAIYEGLDGVRRSIREVWDAWEDFSEVNEQILEPEGRVLVLQTIGGCGRGSGVEVRADGALIFTVLDGRVASIDVFFDHLEALQAAGIADARDTAGERRAAP